MKFRQTSKTKLRRTRDLLLPRLLSVNLSLTRMINRG